MPWKDETIADTMPWRFARIEQLGVSVIIYRYFNRRNAYGANLKAVEKMVGTVGIDVIASGGVSSIQDLINLKNTGAAGAITGRQFTPARSI